MLFLRVLSIASFVLVFNAFLIVGGVQEEKE